MALSIRPIDTPRPPARPPVRRPPPRVRTRRPFRDNPVLILLGILLLAVAAWSFITRPRGGAGPDAGARPGGRRWAWAGLAAVTALVFVAGGVVALAVPVLAWLAWRRPGGRDWVPWVAFGGMVASGLLSAVRPLGEGLFGLFGTFGWPAQACALVALAAALMPAMREEDG